MTFDRVTRMRLDLGTSPVELVAERLEDVRPELREALKLLDCIEHRDVFARVQSLITEIDDVRSVLAERWGEAAAARTAA